MVKKYFAYGVIVTEVIAVGEETRRIHFDECKNGSYYLTADKAEQEGLEHHSHFNHGFVLLETIGGESQPETETEQPAQEAEGTTVTVASISEARDYLADNFGILKSALRSKTAIMTAAAEHNITFDGI